MLLVVVMTLAIVCLIFYQLAQLSLVTTQRAIEQERTTRERWTLVSLRKSILRQVSTVLSTRERQANLAQQNTRKSDGALYFSRFSEQLEVNRLQVKIEARDESARLYLPGLLQVRPAREVRNLIERLQESRALPVRNDALEKEAVPLTSWRDVFEFTAADAVELGSVTSRLTLWGSGHLNTLRADEEVVAELWRVLFGHFPPRELLEARTAYPPPEWTKLIERLNLREEQFKLANAFLSTRSDCFSVRVTMGLGTESQKRYLFVADRNSEHFGFEE